MRAPAFHVKAPSGDFTRGALAVAAVFVADRLTKYWARHWLEPVSPVEVAPFFHLSYVLNTGAAFGMFQGNNAALMAVSLGLLAVLFWSWKRWPEGDRWGRLGLALVAGGALGNLYDRLFYGCVVDFLDFRVWPVFNAADSCISVGAALLAWGMSRTPASGSRA